MIKYLRTIFVLFFLITAASAKAADYEDYYIIKWTSKNCVPCLQWDNKEKNEIIKQKVTVVDIDVDKYPEIAQKYNIDSIPRFWICNKKDRIVVLKYTGYQKKDTLLKAIKDYK